jgi:hypothetical protein
MPAVTSYDIKTWRLALGFAIGAAIPVCSYAVLTGPLWPITLVVGGVLAAVLVFILGLPIYAFLNRRQMLNVFLAIILGGLLTTLPNFLMRLPSGGLQTLVVGNTTLVEGGRLTAEGWRNLLVDMPLIFFPMGAVGGLVAWLIAVGFRVSPLRKTNEQN